MVDTILDYYEKARPGLLVFVLAGCAIFNFFGMPHAEDLAFIVNAIRESNFLETFFLDY